MFIGGGYNDIDSNEEGSDDSDQHHTAPANGLPGEDEDSEHDAGDDRRRRHNVGSDDSACDSDHAAPANGLPGEDEDSEQHDAGDDRRRRRNNVGCDDSDHAAPADGLPGEEDEESLHKWSAEILEQIAAEANLPNAVQLIFMYLVDEVLKLSAGKGTEILRAITLMESVSKDWTKMLPKGHKGMRRRVRDRIKTGKRHRNAKEDATTEVSYI